MLFWWIVIIITVLSGLAMIVSGGWHLINSLLIFRTNILGSLNEDLVVIKVTKSKVPETQDAEKRTQSEKEEISVMEQLLGMLAGLKKQGRFWRRWLFGNPKITLEIAVPSDDEKISFYIAVPRRLRELVEKQIHGFYPEAHIEKIKDYTIFRPQSFTVGSYLKLKKKDAYPIRTYQRMETDPLHNLTNAFSKLESKEEGAAVQLVITPYSGKQIKKRSEQVASQMQQGKHLAQADRQNVFGELIREVGKEMVSVARGGKRENGLEEQNQKNPVALTPEENDIIKQLEAKANKPQFQVNIRLLASAKTKERAEDILSHLENAFVQFEDANLNKFVAKRDKANNACQLAFDFIFRQFRFFQKIVLDTEELASIFHFPISTTETPKINWLKAKTAPPPANIPQEGLLLGYSDFRGIKTEIRLKKDDRRRHLYIVGQTGTGKSTFIEEMAKQDTANKEGICVIDPHGDLIDNIMGSIPRERAEDVIYFNPADMERPFGLNMMEYDEKHPEQRTFVINEMIAILISYTT